MKFIRLILLSGIAFFALACIVSFFIPSHIRVFRMVSIANSNDSVLNKVRDLAQWKNWYPGFENADMKDVQVQNGRVVKANIGDVLLSVKESTDSAVVVSMQKGARSVISGWQVNKDYRKDSLALQGYMDFNLKWYPWEKFSSLILNKSYGDILAQGLRNLEK
ncbi:MAG: hypothetical protein QM594_09390 [Niabella sp.]